MSMLVTLIIGSRLFLAPPISAAMPKSSLVQGEAASGVPTMKDLAETVQTYLASLGSPTVSSNNASVSTLPSSGIGSGTSSPTPTTTKPSTPTTPSGSSAPKTSSNSSSSPSSSTHSGSTTGSGGSTSTSPSSSLGRTTNSGVSSAELAAAKQMFTLINQARVSGGQGALSNNAALNTLAQERAQAMITDNYFNEDSPVYGLPIQMETAAGISAESLGAENIAEAPTITEAFALLMASPPHKANIMAAYFTQVGIGAAYSPSTGWVVSELFAGPSL